MRRSKNEPGQSKRELRPFVSFLRDRSIKLAERISVAGYGLNSPDF